MKTCPLIIALDFSDRSRLEKLLGELEPLDITFKVGLELYTALGAEVFSLLSAFKKPLFLDLKFNDIPNTVKKTVLNFSFLDPLFIDMHATAGFAAIKAAADAVHENFTDTKLLAVTLLTSLDQSDLGNMRIGDRRSTVLKLAEMAKNAGADGVVCSPDEASPIRTLQGDDFIIVTPGIRSVASSDDQKNTASAQAAIKAGANYIVVGRPITESPDPRKAAEDILEEIGYLKP